MSRLECRQSSLRTQIASILLVLSLQAACNSSDAGNSGPRGTPPAVAEQKSADSRPKSAVPERAAALEPATFETFETFWPAFRAAIETSDKDRVASLTRFPFETRGDSDDDPIRRLSHSEFVQALNSMLNEDPGLLMNGKETQREHIARSSTLTERQYTRGDQSARVGQFEFAKHGHHWFFTRAYVTNE